MKFNNKCRSTALPNETFGLNVFDTLECQNGKKRIKTDSSRQTPPVDPHKNHFQFETKPKMKKQNALFFNQFYLCLK